MRLQDFTPYLSGFVFPKYEEPKEIATPTLTDAIEALEDANHVDCLQQDFSNDDWERHNALLHLILNAPRDDSHAAVDQLRDFYAIKLLRRMK